ncbi:MAG: YeeE/YedE thiosulfate transporter family protein [Candidatus Brocadiia bacterium]
MIAVYVIVGLLMGILFGIALEKGRVFEPGMIVGQFQLRNFTMLKVFLAAIATSAAVIAVLHAIGAVELHPKAALYPATIAGSVVFGGGMALAGACPGTVLAQVGAGYKDAWAIVAGGICGAMAYGYMEPVLSPLSDGPGKVTLADQTGLPYGLLAVVMIAVIIAVLVALERWRPWREDLGQNCEGLFFPGEDGAS